MKTRKTTKKQFKRFIKSFNKWVAKFGLFDYRVTFLHIPVEGAYAEIISNPGDCVATVCYSSELPNCPKPGFHALLSEESPESAGKHEAIHLLLSRMLAQAAPEFNAFANFENERLVRILEKVLR